MYAHGMDDLSISAVIFFYSFHTRLRCCFAFFFFSLSIVEILEIYALRKQKGRIKHLKFRTSQTVNRKKGTRQIRTKETQI